MTEDQKKVKMLKRSLVKANYKISCLLEEIEALEAEKKAEMTMYSYSETESLRTENYVLKSQFKEFMDKVKSFKGWVNYRLGKL